MFSRLFAPRLLALHALAVLVTTVLVMLGFWQLDRFHEERALRSRADVDRTPRVALATVSTPGLPLPPSAAGRLVTAAGSYLPDRQFLVAGYRSEGTSGRTGFLVVTPLRLSDGSLLPVARGWAEQAAAADQPAPAGAVSVVGWLRPPDATGRGRAGLPARQVAGLAAADLAQMLAGGQLHDGYLLLARQRPAAGGTGGLRLVEPPLPGRGGYTNLAYAVQWWAFAGFALFMWSRFARDLVAGRPEGTATVDVQSATEPTEPTGHRGAS